MELRPWYVSPFRSLMWSMVSCLYSSSVRTLIDLPPWTGSSSMSVHLFLSQRQLWALDNVWEVFTAFWEYGHQIWVCPCPAVLVLDCAHVLYDGERAPSDVCPVVSGTTPVLGLRHCVACQCFLGMSPSNAGAFLLFWRHISMCLRSY